MAGLVAGDVGGVHGEQGAVGAGDLHGRDVGVHVPALPAGHASGGEDVGGDEHGVVGHLGPQPLLEPAAAVRDERVRQPLAHRARAQRQGDVLRGVADVHPVHAVRGLSGDQCVRAGGHPDVHVEPVAADDPAAGRHHVHRRHLAQHRVDVQRPHHLQRRFLEPLGQYRPPVGVTAVATERQVQHADLAGRADGQRPGPGLRSGRDGGPHEPRVGGPGQPVAHRAGSSSTRRDSK